MTAHDVRASLAVRWPDSEYITIEEAPEDNNRGGRKIDLLVISLWRSRGLERDGVEIKVSMQDWRRELANAEKADWWWRHVHRFWVAAPADLAAKIRDEVPSSWGLLACETGKSTKVLVKAPKKQPEPLSWNSTVGLMRAAADAGIAALQRAESKGYDRGVARQKELQEQAGPDGMMRTQRDIAERNLAELRQKVRDFEEASGIKITDYWPTAAVVGRVVQLVHRDLTSAIDLPELLARHADTIQAQAKGLRQTAERLTAATNGTREAT